MKIAFTTKKTCTTPTIVGWITIAGIVTIFGCVAVGAVNPFLSLNKPTNANVMVIEGWLPDFAIKQALDEFNCNHYSLLITTGAPLEKGFFLSGYKTYANLAAQTLINLGMDSSKLAVVPSTEVRADRTFASACAVRVWIAKSTTRISGFNVISLGPHSRRTLLLYKKAFNRKESGAADAPVRIGIKSYKDITYDPAMWWRTSNGFRIVSDELIAYAYAKFIFIFKRNLP